MNLTTLEKLIENDFGIVVQSDEWAKAENHDSLVIDRRKQIFFWNSKEVIGDAFVYLTKIRGYSNQDAKEYLKHSGYSSTYITNVKDQEEVIVYPKLVDIFHQDLENRDKEYFYRRTITDETISRYKLGYYNGFYTIPIYQDGLLKQIQLRRDDPKTIRGYYRKVGPTLFNSDIMKLTNKIFIVEAPTSCLVMNQNGLPCISYISGAISFQEEWFHYFLHQKEVYICLDNDEAGLKGSLKIARILGENKCKIYNFWDFEEKGYDANDFFIDGGTKDELLRLIEDKSKYKFELKDKNDSKFTRQSHRKESGF
jgi:DNA primase